MSEIDQPSNQSGAKFPDNRRLVEEIIRYHKGLLSEGGNAGNSEHAADLWNSLKDSLVSECGMAIDSANLLTHRIDRAEAAVRSDIALNEDYNPEREWRIAQFPFGWRDKTIPSIGTVAGVVSSSRFRKMTKQVLDALFAFELELTREWGLDGLNERSEAFSRLDPEINRDSFRFYFNIAATVTGALVITVFLEPTAEEHAARPNNYVNAYKNLHHSFLTEDGIVRKSRFAFRRDKTQSERADYSAYSKFYLLPPKGKDQFIKIVAHPFQRNRLMYDPERENLFKNLKEYVFKHIRILRTVRGRLQRSDLADDSVNLELVENMLGECEKVFKASGKKSFDEAVASSAPIIQGCASNLRSTELMQINVKATGGSSRNTDLRKQIRKFARSLSQFRNIANRKGHEEGDTASRVHSGADREYILLALTDLLKDSLQLATGLNVRRYVLSSEQIKSIRLINQSPTLRDRISRLPRALELYFPIETLSIPLERVLASGEIISGVRNTEISVVSLDPRKAF